MSVTESLLNDIRTIIESVLPPLTSESDIEGGLVPEGEDESSAPSHTSVDKIPSEDGQYVKKHLGVPLCLALAEIVRLRPSDPIHFLGHWLMKWRWNTDEKQLHEDRVNALTAEQLRVEEEIAEKKRRAEMRLQAEIDAKRHEAEEVVNLELDRLLEAIDLPDLPEPELPEPETLEPESQERYGEGSVHSYENAREPEDDFYDDSPGSPKKYQSERLEDDYDDNNN